MNKLDKKSFLDRYAMLNTFQPLHMKEFLKSICMFKQDLKSWNLRRDAFLQLHSLTQGVLFYKNI